MKLLRFLEKNTHQIKLGFMTHNKILPMEKLLPDAPTSMIDLINSLSWKKLHTTPLPVDLPRIQPNEIEFLPPIERPGKIICVGLNYRDHVLEGGRNIPEYPTIFLKASSAIIGHSQPILLPEASQMVDFEAELAVVIGTEAKNCLVDTAYDHVAGYTILNDVSERDYQRRTPQWTMGKSCDTFAPIGPVLVTKDEIPDPHCLTITGSLNDFEMQCSNTKHLIFTVPFLIEYISAVMTLHPGDIISTGTPGGVGVFREPQIFMKSGDVVDISIEKIGTLHNPIH